MKEKTASIIGSTGLIGSRLLELLLRENHFKQIRLIVRRPVETNNPAVEVKVIDFSDNDSFKSAVAGSDVLFCATGTTRAKVRGDMAAYYKVDYDIPVSAARFCEETGCRIFLLVSSIGADSKSKNFYLRIKGETEDRIREMKIASVSVFRPSLLLGKRNEFRLGEKLAQFLSVPLSVLFPPKYKPIKAETVARAMLSASKKPVQGFSVYHYREMIASFEDS